MSARDASDSIAGGILVRLAQPDQTIEKEEQQ